MTTRTKTPTPKPRVRKSTKKSAKADSTKPTEPAEAPAPEPKDYSPDVPGTKRWLQTRATAGLRSAPGWPQDNVLSRAAAERFATTRIPYSWFGDSLSSRGARDVLSTHVEVLLQLSKKTKVPQKAGSESTYLLTVKGLHPGKYRHTIKATGLNDARSQAEHVVDAIVFRLADNMFVEFAKTTGLTLSELLHSAAVALQKTGTIKKRELI